MEFRDIFVMALIIGLFTIAIISFSTIASKNNNANVSIDQNPILNKMFGNVSNELNHSNTDADNARKALQEEEKHPILTTLGFAFNSILSAGNTFMTVGVNMFGYMFTFAQDTFSLSPIITGTLMAIIIGILILAIWSLIRSGR